jgi:hypothetical protein
MGFELLGLGFGHWEWEMKSSKLIEVMRVDSQFFHVLSILKYNFDPFLVSLVMISVVNYVIHSTTCEQAYFGAQNCVPKSDAQRNM